MSAARSRACSVPEEGTLVSGFARINFVDMYAPLMRRARTKSRTKRRRIERASMYDVWFRCIGMAVVPPRVEYWSSIVEMSP